MSDYPKRLRTDAAVDYVEHKHGIKLSAKTMRNHRSSGIGPAWKYFGSVPYVEPAELDRWVAEVLSDRPANRSRRRYDAREAELEPESCVAPRKPHDDESHECGDGPQSVHPVDRCSALTQRGM